MDISEYSGIIQGSSFTLIGLGILLWTNGGQVTLSSYIGAWIGVLIGYAGLYYFEVKK